MIISPWILLRMRNVLDKFVEKLKTHILCSIAFSRKSCRLWNKVEKYGTARQATDDNIIRRMRFACWITKATDTHLVYVIIIAFPRQQWLRERASILRLCVHCVSLLIDCACSTGNWKSSLCRYVKLWPPVNGLISLRVCSVPLRLIYAQFVL
jgi:hypothetical protein